MEAPSGECLRGKGWHGVLCRLKAVWSMPERFRVVYTMQGAIQVLWFTFTFITVTIHGHHTQLSTANYEALRKQEHIVNINGYLCPGRKAANCRVHRSSEARFVMNCVTWLSLSTFFVSNTTKSVMRGSVRRRKYVVHTCFACKNYQLQTVNKYNAQQATRSLFLTSCLRFCYQHRIYTKIISHE